MSSASPSSGLPSPGLPSPGSSFPLPFLDLPAVEGARGTVVLPGSKSLSNRILLLAALSQGMTQVQGLLDSDDTRVMRTALGQLGVRLDNNVIHGVGGVFPVKEANLFLGNAGTAFRPLTAALAFSGGQYHLSGVARMHERPIRDLVEALRALGCLISYEGQDGFPPLHIQPGSSSLRADSPSLPPSLQIVRVRGDVSSQFLSALLMALPLTGQPAVVEVEGPLISQPYVDLTLNMMTRFGVEVQREGWQRFHVPKGARYQSPGTLHVEGDASSASYFLAAGALGGGPVRVVGVGRQAIQGDVRFADQLERMGATITWGEDWIEAKAPSGGLRPLEADCNHIPDAAMTLAVCALFAKGGATTLTRIASWRVKETDRIAAMACELRKLGATVEEGADFIRIIPPPALKPGVAIDTYDDHRMAMCFSLVCLGGVPVRINDPGCVAKTFPDYFERFKSVLAR